MNRWQAVARLSSMALCSPACWRYALIGSVVRTPFRNPTGSGWACVGTRQSRGLSRKRKRPLLPRDYADLKQRAMTTDRWRWGESNPRPLLWSCAFYGRSQCIRFLGPGICRWPLLRRAQYQWKSLCALMLNAEASPLADARIRVGNDSRTDGLSNGGGELTPRGRSRPWPRQCCCYWHLFFCMDR